jgi:hypothetical protein
MLRDAGVAAVPIAFAALGLAVPTATDAEDQAAADDAVAVFNERLTDAGWTSTGPPEVQDSSDFEGGGFGDCFGGFDLYLENTELRVDGETARAYSDQFTFTGEGPETTEAIADFANAAALVITVDESSVEALDTFVAQLGSSETTECLSALPEFEEVAEGDMTVDVEWATESELGVGESSARFTASIDTSGAAGDFSFDLSYDVARVDRSLVLVLYGSSGASPVELDTAAELDAMVDALG